MVADGEIFRLGNPHYFDEHASGHGLHIAFASGRYVFSAQYLILMTNILNIQSFEIPMRLPAVPLQNSVPDAVREHERKAFPRLALHTVSVDEPVSQATDAPAAELPKGGIPPTPEQLELLAWHSKQLESATAEEIITWAVEHYFPKLTMATAFGPEGCFIISLLAKIEPRVHVFNLETGYQFKETLELRDRLAERYGIVVEYKSAPTTVAEYEAQHGGPVYKTNPDQCCYDRKVSVLKQAAMGWDAWMSGIRRDQSPDRATAPIIGWDKKFNLVKISPLANYTKADIWKRIVEEQIPYNPLHDQGYPSIGCWPCTRAVLFGEDERAGRWSGFAKTECGLHTKD